ncbi:MAG: glycosyltransferase family 4 protein [Methanobacterium sp.]|nr:glycosyltransferase family 4 protein [Methanobacterium sp.]
MKIAIICPDFKQPNINRLPWKYIYEIAKYLKNREFEVVIITNTHEGKVDEIPLIQVKKLFTPFKGETQELLDVLEKMKPDKCLMLLGLTSFLRNSFQMNIPVYGIFTSPLYSFRELIKNMGLLNSIKYHRYTAIHYLNALIPDYMVKKWGKSFRKIIFLSQDTRAKMIDKGFIQKRSIFIPVGMDTDFLEPPNPGAVKAITNTINPENVPLIMYFTSPLTLRGTDTLMEAFVRVRKEQPCKLIFLSRLDNDKLKKEEELLMDIAEREDVKNSVEFISQDLNFLEIKEYLSTANLVCLPFKIVISDVPISILEAMALGKPVISTKIASIPELLNGNGIMVQVNDEKELKEKIMKLLSDKELSKDMSLKEIEYMKNYPTWTDVGKLMENTIKE